MQVVCPCCGTVIDIDGSDEQPLLFNITEDDATAEALGILFGEEVNEDRQH